MLRASADSGRICIRRRKLVPVRVTGSGLFYGINITRLLLQPDVRQPWRVACDGAGSGTASDDGSDCAAPMSLAVLSGARSQRKRGIYLQKQLHQQYDNTLAARRGNPSQSLPSAPGVSEQGHPNLSTIHSTTSDPQLMGSGSGCTDHRVAGEISSKPTSAAAAVAAGAPLPPADLHLDFKPRSPRTSLLDTKSGAVVPTPCHPPVTFRTVAELRGVLQERQAGVRQTTSTSKAVTESKDDDGNVAAVAAEAPTVRGPPPLPPSRSPRRFFSGVRFGDSPIVSTDKVQEDDDGKPLNTSSGDASTDIATAVAPAAPSPEALVERMGHSKGSSVGPELDEDSEYQKAKPYALSLLHRSPLPTSELIRRLLAQGHPHRTVEQLVTWLVEGGALNDRLYARLYAASKWNSNLMAPSKIKQELTAQGVAVGDITAALTHVFGPSRRIRLTGAVTPEELAIRDTLLGAARRHVEQRSRTSAFASTSGPTSGSTSRSVSSKEHDASNSTGTSSASRSVSMSPNTVGGRWGTSRDSGADWAARAKEQNAKRRRLAMWLQYRGHEMDLILKVFELLQI